MLLVLSSVLMILSYATLLGDTNMSFILVPITLLNFSFGAHISDEGSKVEVLARIAQTIAALGKLKPIYGRRKRSELPQR